MALSGHSLGIHDQLSGYCVVFAGIIERDLYMVIPQINRIHKGVNDLSAEFLAPAVTVPELLHPVDDLFSFQVCVRGYLQIYGALQLHSLMLQFQQAALGVLGDDPHFYGFHQVSGGLFVFGFLLLQHTQLCGGSLPFLIGHHCIGDPLYHVRLENIAQGGVHHYPLNIVLADMFLIAVPLKPSPLAGVIIV